MLDEISFFGLTCSGVASHGNAGTASLADAVSERPGVSDGDKGDG